MRIEKKEQRKYEGGCEKKKKWKGKGKRRASGNNETVKKSGAQCGAKILCEMVSKNKHEEIGELKEINRGKGVVSELQE